MMNDGSLFLLRGAQHLPTKTSSRLGGDYFYDPDLQLSVDRRSMSPAYMTIDIEEGKTRLTDVQSETTDDD
jgi:hypothetical protein